MSQKSNSAYIEKVLSAGKRPNGKFISEWARKQLELRERAIKAKRGKYAYMGKIIFTLPDGRMRQTGEHRPAVKASRPFGKFVYVPKGEA